MKNNQPLISGCAIVLTVIAAAIALCAIFVAALGTPARAQEQPRSVHDTIAKASRESVCFYLIAKIGVNVNLRDDASASAKFIKTLNRASGIFEYDDAKIEQSSGLTWAHIKTLDGLALGWVAVKYFDSACDLLALTASAVTQTATARPTLAATAQATPTRLIIIDVLIDGTKRATCALPCRIDLQSSTP